MLSNEAKIQSIYTNLENVREVVKLIGSNALSDKIEQIYPKRQFNPTDPTAPFDDPDESFSDSILEVSYESEDDMEEEPPQDTSFAFPPQPAVLCQDKAPTAPVVHVQASDPTGPATGQDQGNLIDNIYDDDERDIGMSNPKVHYDMANVSIGPSSYL